MHEDTSQRDGDTKGRLAASPEATGLNGESGALRPWCLEWTGELSDDGYGVMPLALRVSGERYVHRTAWLLGNGRIPRGKWVLHRCNNRRCYEPTHLYLGTNTENVRDRVASGTGAKGERHGRAKLTDAQVEEIHTDIRQGVKQRVLADFWGVSRSTISLIASDKRRGDSQPSTPEGRAYAAAGMRKSRAKTVGGAR